jgi:hypothetical protein
MHIDMLAQVDTLVTAAPITDEWVWLIAQPYCFPYEQITVPLARNTYYRISPRLAA